MARTQPKKRRSTDPTNSRKRGRGRPSDFRDEFCQQAEKLCKLIKATDEDLAAFFEKDVATINRWKARHAEFRAAIKRGKRLADMEVAFSLHQRATGLEAFEEQAIKVKTIEYADNGRKLRETEDVKIVRVRRYYPPETVAGIFWLKNREHETWRDKHEIDHSGSLDVNQDEVRAGIEGKLARIAAAGAAASVPRKP